MDSWNSAENFMNSFKLSEQSLMIILLGNGKLIHKSRKTTSEWRPCHAISCRLISDESWLMPYFSSDSTTATLPDSQAWNSKLCFRESAMESSWICDRFWLLHWVSLMPGILRKKNLQSFWAIQQFWTASYLKIQKSTKSQGNQQQSQPNLCQFLKKISDQIVEWESV